MGIAIGTSGFSYDDWKGVLYPADLAKDDYLRYYSMFFPFAELDFSYYRMPEFWRLEAMAAAVPQSFRFAIKAHRSLTHDRAGDWKASASEFSAALRVRAFRERLSAVLLQFPFSFRYDDANRRYLGALTRELAEFPLVVEFRNAEWLRPSVAEEAAKRSLCLAATDLPALEGLPATSFPFRGDRAYLRFHGRNQDAWWSGDAASRYDYSYAEGELRSWTGPLLAAEASGAEVLVAFNNHARGNAVKDARRLKILLDEARPRLQGEAPAQGAGPGAQGGRGF